MSNIKESLRRAAEQINKNSIGQAPPEETPELRAVLSGEDTTSELARETRAHLVYGLLVDAFGWGSFQ